MMMGAFIWLCSSVCLTFENLSGSCLIATVECSSILNALLSCCSLLTRCLGFVVAAARSPGLDDTSQNIFRKLESHMALQYAKLRHPSGSLYVGQEEHTLLSCVAESSATDETATNFK